MKREILLKITIDWEDYDDVCDELVIEDLELKMKSGSYYEILESVSDAIDFAEWIDSEGWRQIEGSKWYNTISHKYKVTDYFTTTELYEQFKQIGGDK